MARDEVRIYRTRRPLKTALTVLIAAAAVVVVLAIAVFFGFRRYIVYTSDGVRLEIPWLEEPSPQGDDVPTTPDPPLEPESPDSAQGGEAEE